MSEIILTENSYFFEPTLQLKVVKREPELPYRLHSHEFFELVFVVSGRGINFTATEQMPLREGSVFFIPPGVEHGYKELENLVLYNVLYGQMLISAHSLDLVELPGYRAFFLETQCIPNMLLSPSQIAELLPLIQLMEKEADDQSYGSGSRTLAYAYLIELLVRLSRIFDQTPRETNQTARRLWEVISYMDANLDISLSTEDLTEVANMSTSTLNRWFKQSTGLSPIEFHIHKRIAKACTLIQERGLSMSQISESCGFKDPNYFSRQFRKVMGMSPKQYERIFTNRFT
ncbi:MAG: AraC family transcriptional regulator [Spirochaetia bacterium]|nr:AraC family transcriptional regulator [Spirochaetia bacterium]